MNTCPVPSCSYKSSEHGVKVHLGRKHSANKKCCDECGEQFHRPPSKVKEDENTFCSNRCKNEYRVGSNNPNGTNSTEIICTNCDSRVVKPKSVVDRGQKNRYCDKDCMIEHWREEGIQSGEDNPMYGGGDSSWRSRSEWLQTRSQVLKSDSICQWCESEDNLHVHHIIPVFAGGEKYNAENLTVLCQECHITVHRYIDSIFVSG